MVSQPLSRLPSTEELPCSDDKPVDNVGLWTSRSEDQNLLALGAGPPPAL